MTGTLAIDGGDPVRTAPLPPWPVFAADEREAVDRVLTSGRANYWTGGEGRAFEAQFAEFVGAPHAIALANGTAALELALWGLGIGPGDEVVVPARTFIATAGAVAARGAVPVCADVDRDSGCVTAETVAAALTGRTRAVIVVHLGGWPCDMTSIAALTAGRGLALVEDCAQALGASWDGRAVGTFGDAAAFSFCQDKIMTTGGEGGMLVTRDHALWERCWSYKDHGKGIGSLEPQAPGVDFRWLHERFGTNWRMTEMQAAIGCAALPKVPGWVDARRAAASVLGEAFAGLPALRTAAPPSEAYHACYKHYVYVRPEALRQGWDRGRVASAVSAEGVPCMTGSCPEIYLERAFDGIRPAERLGVARELGETSLMLMVHPTLAESDIADTAAAVVKVMEAASL